MLYKTQYADTPAIIARKHGVGFDALIGANPQKPTTVVAGVRTWRDLRPGEVVQVPVGVGVGSVASDAVGAMMAAGSPCDQANVALVCAAQRALGVGADGKWGSGSASAAQRVVAGAPAGCSPRPGWWAPAGQSNCPSASAPTASTTAVPAAVQALTSVNPCLQSSATLVATAQAAMGVASDGKYGTDSATRARALLGSAAPPACSPRPSWWTSPGQVNVQVTPSHAATTPTVAPPSAAAPSGTAVPAAVQALTTVDPCLQSSATLVATAQAAMGIASDGKYGTDSATRARALLGSAAPPACSPRPSWWTAPGQVNVQVTPSHAATTPTIAPAQPAPVAVTCPPGTSLNPATGACVPIPTAPPAPGGGGGGTQPVVVPPSTATTTTTTTTKGGLSTGAIVAGAVGVVALAGIVAMAAGGGGKRVSGGHHRATRKSAHRKAAKHAPSKSRKSKRR